jgi:flagellar hook-associated protein 3 FlgL
MRVTANTFPDTLVDQLSQLAVRQNRLQSQAATGQRIRLPEDDPTAMRRVIDLQNESKNLGQYQRNISTLKEYASASFTAIKSLKKICDRAGEIATLADDTKSPEELRIYAIEIN